MSGLFGTDGARGAVVSEISCELAMQAGRAAAELLAKEEGGAIIVAKDKRLSSDVLEAAVCAGVCSSGVDAVTIGAAPAAVASYAVRSRKASAAIMITGASGASEGSGVRIFDADGARLDERIQLEFDKNVLGRNGAPPQKRFDAIGRMLSLDSAVDEYVERVWSLVPTDLGGMRIAVACREKSVADAAEKLFARLGASVELVSAADGEEPGLGPGLTDMEILMDYVAAGDCVCGLAIGDNGGSCLAVDENGSPVDGDHLLAIFAKRFMEKGALKENVVVANAASGLGLFNFLKENGMTTVSTGSCARSALDRMIEGGYSLGGDRSGHVFFLDDSPCEDGLLAGARLLEIMRLSGSSLSALASEMRVLPSISLNVRIADSLREIWKNDKDVTDLIEWYQGEFGETGRVLVRESGGAAPFVTITVEGGDFGRINAVAMEIADRIRARCGSSRKE